MTTFLVIVKSVLYTIPKKVVIHDVSFFNTYLNDCHYKATIIVWYIYIPLDMGYYEIN